LMPVDLRYAASFMDRPFSPSKISAQVKLLDPLDGQAGAIHRKFGMARGAQLKRTPPTEPRVLQRTFIQQWRKARGWNQTDLGLYIGVSTGTISQIENAETGYKQEYLEGIAEALECEPADLLTRKPDDPEPIWKLWEAATADQRKQILKVAAALLTGS